MILKPAALYKTQIEERAKEDYYTQKMFYYNGGIGYYGIYIDAEPENGLYQYAILDDKEETILGVIGFKVNYHAGTATQFGLYSFDDGNFAIGKAVYAIIDKLKDMKIHRIEWRMIGGNPVERHYDSFCKKYNGRKIELYDVAKDIYGNYYNEYIYEVLL